MSSLLGLAKVRIEPDFTGFAAEANRTIGGTMRKVAGVAAAAFAAAGVGSLLKDAIGQASDLSETVNKSNVIFGKNAASIRDWSKTAATNFGLSQQAALDAAAGMGNMLQQLGYTGEAAAKASTDTVKLAADLGSFNNLETGDVLDRIGAAMRGEYDSLQLLIPNINAARVEQEAMTATGKTVASELTAQEKATATLAIVQKDGAAAANDFAETSNGLANRTKIASAQFDDMKAKLGTALLPAMTSVMGFISTTALPALGSLGDTLTDTVIPAVQDAAKWIGDNAGPILTIAGLITAVFIPHLIALGTTATINAAKTVAGFVATQASAVASAAVHSAQVLRMIGSWVLLGAQSLLQAARVAAAWVLAMGPVGWVIATVGGLVALVIANWETIKTKTSEIWGKITGSISDKVGAVKDWVSEKFTALKHGVTGIWIEIRDTVGRIWDGLVAKVKSPIKVTFDFVNNRMIGPVNRILKEFPGGLKIPELPTLASGGLVRGPGTGTSDSILGVDPRTGTATAAVSNGEYVVNAAATRSHRALLEAINSGTLPGFARGGLVGDVGGPLDFVGDTWEKAKSALGTVKDFAVNMVKEGARKAAGLILNPLLDSAKTLIPNKVPLTMLEGGLEKMVNAILGKGDEADKSRQAEQMAGNPGPGGAVAGSWSGLWAMTKAAFPMAKLNSSVRNTPDAHGRGKAIDVGLQGVPGGLGNSYMAAMKRWWYDTNGSKLYELIYNGIGNDRPNVKSGKNFPYSLGTQLQHRNHLHIGTYDTGGVLGHGMTGLNLSGKPERVLSPEQTESFDRWLNGNRVPEAAPLVGSLTINTTEAGPQATVDALSWELRKIKRGVGGYR